MKSNGTPPHKKLKTTSHGGVAATKLIKSTLPHDVTTDILYKLALKDFVRFRSVSKFFNSTLTGSQLIQKISKPENQNQDLLFKSSNNLFYVLDSKNSTNLKRSCFTKLNYSGSRNNILLYNPLTKEEIEIHTYFIKDNKNYQFSGSGYDPSSKDYKSVAGFWLESESRCFFQIFNLRNCITKEQYLEKRICDKIRPVGEAVYISGNLYWAAVDTSSNKEHMGHIVKFNLFREEFSDVALPSYYNYKFNLLREKFSDVALHSYYKDKPSIHVAGINGQNGCLWASLNNLWEMTTDVWCMLRSDLWVKLVTLNLNCDDFKSRFHLICCLENGSIVFQRSSTCLEIYDPENKSWSVSEFPKDLEMEWKVTYEYANVSSDDEV